MGDEAPAVGRLDQLFGQLVDDRVLDAEQVAAALLIGRLGAPILALLVAWRQRLAEALDGHVGVELVAAPLGLRRIDGAHVHVDTDAFEVLLIGQHHTLEARIAQ